MFNKLKQVKDLRSQAKNMQGMLAQEKITVEKNGITVEVDGNMEIKEIKISEGISKDKLGGALKNAINDALKKAQRIMAEKMRSEMGGIPGLGG
jgi:DNA-binding protein YbaB